MEIYIVKVYPNGNRFWYQNDKLHRPDGPAIERANGDRFWFQNGLRDRVNGPAVEWVNGTRFWYQKGQLDRVDGPAVEWADGGREWWIMGEELTEEEFNQQTKKTACEDKTVIIDGITYKLVKE